MKSILSLLLALAMLVSCVAFAEGNTLTGTAMGMKHPITVEVDLDGETIADVRVVECEDTATIRDAAIESVPQRIVEQQNIEVDVVAGATMTSFGIRNAVKNALESAGIDVEPYKKGSDAVAEKPEAEAQEYDVVVVGGGIAGMSAAIQLRRDGVERVLVLEKEGYTGGSSLVCGGGIWVENTAINDEIGVNASEEDFIAFFKTRGEDKPLNEALLTNVYNTVGDVATFITENGLPYTPDTWTLGHPDSQLPVIWSIHNTEYPWESGESGYFNAVADMAARQGAEIRVNSKVTGLVYEGNTVTGVRVEDRTSTYTVNAKKVILATGGFTRNKDMVAEYAPDFVNAFAMTGAGSTGDGITMTRELGAQVIGEGMMGLMGTNMQYGYYGPIGNLVWLTKMIVNKEGATFGMDSAFYSETLALLLQQTDSMGIGVFDGTTELTERLDMAVAANVAKKFDTLDELAEGYGIDAQALAATAEAQGVAEGPYYGLPIKPLFIGSIPGLKVDADCRVLNADDQPVENLLAAGELIFGNLFAVRYPASGTGIGMSTYTGALAAKTALAEING